MCKGGREIVIQGLVQDALSGIARRAVRVAAAARRQVFFCDSHSAPQSEQLREFRRHGTGMLNR